MANVNEVRIIGRVVRDAKIIANDDGTKSVYFTVAVNRRYKKKDATEPTNEATYIDCEAWNRVAKYFEASAKKGQEVLINGRLRNCGRQGEDGKREYKLRVVVTGIEVLAKASRREDSDAKE